MSAMTHDAEWLLHLGLLRNEQIQDKERRRGRPGPVGGNRYGLPSDGRLPQTH